MFALKVLRYLLSRDKCLLASMAKPIVAVHSQFMFKPGMLRCKTVEATSSKGAYIWLKILKDMFSGSARINILLITDCVWMSGYLLPLMFLVFRF